MVLKSEQHRIKTLLRDTITLLCKNGLAFKKEFSIEALIGVTLDQDDVLLVSINEIVRSENASAEVAESAANHDAEQGCSDAEENHSDKRQSSARPPAVRDIPSRKRPHMAMKREPPESGGGNGNGNAPDRPDGRGGDVWGQAGPPMLSLDSALDDSSFHSSSEHAQDEPSAKRRPPPPQQHDADDDDDDDGQGQHDDNGDEDLYEDDDTKDVIVIKEETDRDEWSGSSCSQQAGPGRPYRHDNSSGIPSGDGTGEVPYSAQGDRDLAAVLQSGSLVPVGMQQAGLPMWSEGGPQGSRTSTVTSDGAAVNQQGEYSGTTASAASSAAGDRDAREPGPGCDPEQPGQGDGDGQDDGHSRVKKQHVCEQCNKRFHNAFNLARHKQLHMGVYRLHCPECGKGVMDTCALRSHLAAVHGISDGEKEAAFVCAFCGKSYPYKQSLNYHLFSAHDVKIPKKL